MWKAYGSFTYKITKCTAKKKEVTVLAFNKKKKATSAKIPSAIKISGQVFKVNSISKEDKLKFVTEYMSRNEIRESLKIAKAKNLQQLIIYSLLKLKKYNAVYFILSRL